MTHQVPEYFGSVSEQLFHILDNVGYSRGDRDRMTRAVTETELFLNMAMGLGLNNRLYICGSRGEGSTGPELQSDMDNLYESARVKVCTDLTQCKPYIMNLRMVKDIHNHPGYVKLQYIVILPDNTPVPVYNRICTDSGLTIDSESRSVLLNSVCFFPNTIISGPAIHFYGGRKELSCDNVSSLRCEKWPQEGYEWFMRRRLHGWPTPAQISDACYYGCFATPIGHPHSSDRHLEWRLSFSIAERDRTRSFEDPVMKVYILLKMIRKTYIEPVVGDAFSSYHCKVCMLWMREKTPAELWISKNLLFCLILCIRQLYEWAMAMFCPDYFIHTNNVYDRNIIGAVKTELIQLLRYLLSTDCLTVLSGIKCCKLGQRLTNEISRFGRSIQSFILEENIIYHSIIEAACDCRYSILKYIPQHLPTLIDYLKGIVHASRYLPYSMQYPVQYVMMVLYSQLGFRIATIYRKNAHILSQEKVDNLVRLASGCLSLGIYSDATSVRLKICGLGIEFGNHDLTEACLQYISNYHMMYMYSVPVIWKPMKTSLKCKLNSNVEKLCKKRYSTKDLLQTQTSFSVVYVGLEMSITPKPLRMEMFRSIEADSVLRDKYNDSWFDWGVVESLICLYFFQYLNYSMLGKQRHKQVAMENLIHVINTEPDIHHRDTAFNLLGYCFLQENQLTKAFRCFMQSWKIRPYHNAAKFYLGILFNRVHATIVE